MKKLVILAILLAVITGLAGFYFLSNLEKKAEMNSLGGTTPVVVAKVQILEHTKITAEMIEVKNIPTQAVNALAVDNVGDILGRVTKVTIESQEQILTTKLIGEEDREAELSYAVSEGYRALTIRTDDISGVGGYMIKGDRIDIVSTMDMTVNGQMKTATQMVAENLEILAIGIKQSGSDTSAMYTAVTVAVPVKDVLKISFALSEGKYQLVLRSVADQKIVKPPVYTLQ